MRVAILDDYQGVATGRSDWAIVDSEIELVVFDDHLFDEQEIAERLKDFEIICAMRERTPFPRSQLELLPNLKLLITSGMRNRGIDSNAASELGITVCGTPSVGRPTADLAWGLILGLARQIPMEDRRVRSGGWQKSIGVGLQGKTLGLAGVGNLGSSMVPIAKAFGMKVIGWSENLSFEKCAELDIEKVTKEDLLSRSDFISIHLILSERTRGIFGATELSKMKSTAYIVNTSRGPIIDEDALVSALEHGVIAGAGIDVFSVEPLPERHPLRNLENLIVTPHLGYVEASNYDAYFKGYAEAIRAYIDGKPVNVISG
ncbi:MAG: D-2-hydroxyacid dehydrogenase family protein [Rhodospirillaceae bacterium]